MVSKGITLIRFCVSSLNTTQIISCNSRLDTELFLSSLHHLKKKPGANHTFDLQVNMIEGDLKVHIDMYLSFPQV